MRTMILPSEVCHRQSTGPKRVGYQGSPLPFIKGEEGSEGLPKGCWAEFFWRHWRFPLAPHLSPLPESGERKIDGLTWYYNNRSNRGRISTR